MPMSERDIGPDEKWLSNRRQINNNAHEHESLTANDLEPDTALGQRPPDPFRQNGHLRTEPLDESSDSERMVYGRVFPRSIPQARNGPNHYHSEENRLATFVDWRYQRIVRKESLAQNGFVYTGSADKVRCNFCNVVLHHWEPSDIVEHEHRRNSPTCPFLLGENVGNIPCLPSSRPGVYRNSASGANFQQDQTCARVQPASCSSQVAAGMTVSGKDSSTGDEEVSSSSRPMYSSEPINPIFATEPSRLMTFETWPHQMNQKPEQLAESGLFYTGDGDKVKCFHCDVLLYNWEPGDDPFKEHARWKPDCHYIRLVKGDQFVDNVKEGRETDETVMETPAVQALLMDGYSQGDVRKALATLAQKNVPVDQVSAELILLTIMDQESSQHDAASSNGHQHSEDVECLQRENESLREKQQCKVCMERDVEVIFYPCKHFICCASCGTGVSLCPICRRKIQSMDKVFMS